MILLMHIMLNPYMLESADSTEVKDVVQSHLETQKNDAPRDIIEVPIALVSIPNLFDDTKGVEESAADSHNPEDKEKARSSDIVYVETGHMNPLPSLQDCLTQTLFSHQLKNCENCSKVAEVPETNGSKNVEPIMASTNVNSIDGDKAELSDRKTCPSKQSSDLSSLLVGKSCDEKDLASCSTADEKAESHESAAPSFLPTDGNGGANETQLISKLPPVLTIQLERYTPGRSKLKGHVSFKEILDLGPFMDSSSEDKDNLSYRLVGVIVHSGDTRNGGHYLAYVRGIGSTWVCASDGDITVVSLEQVLGCEAYILFYERMEDRGMAGILPTN
uniref:Uncharacterized protein n=1 Tax=Avena sativa TaxID=4498 RepID=A0ACD5YB55_AVESA